MHIDHAEAYADAFVDALATAGGRPFRARCADGVERLHCGRCGLLLDELEQCNYDDCEDQDG